MGTSVLYRCLTVEGARIELIEGRAVEHLREAVYTSGNARGLMASGHAGALRLAAGGDVEDELRAQAPLLVGEAYLTGAGKLATRGLLRVAHGIVAAEPGTPPKRAAVTRAFTRALHLLDYGDRRARTRALTLPDIGLRIPASSVSDAAGILVDPLLGSLRRGSALEEIAIVSLEPAYLLACATLIVARGGADI